MLRNRRLICLAVAVLLAGATQAQSNQDPTINVKLGFMSNFDSLGRTGTFPNGLNAAATSTTVCNQGGVVEWFAPMDAEHPTIAFLVARESNGRFEQISDRSHLKHGFFALTSSQCTPCTPPGGGFGDYLGVGCSDTYGIGNNGDNYWLGPADEIDPWLGTWDPNCSFFDEGLFGSPCDSFRSFTQSQANSLGPVGNRINLKDADLNVSGASYWYQAQYVVATEPEGVRFDNLGSRAFTPSWTGSSWNLAESGTLLADTILQRWPGAAMKSNTNGADDGRVYVANIVTGPTEGFYHYEYAVHNRDNARGIGEYRIPLCAGTRVLNAGFGDIDDDAGNDWSISIESAGTELVFRDLSGSNDLAWNTIYNFWFDADASPVSTSTTLVQANPGTGAASFGVPAPSPVGLYNAYAGAGCSLDGTPPTLYAQGSPARATLGNNSFELVSGGNVPGQVNILVASNGAGTGSFSLGCTFWLPGTIDDLYGFASAITDGSGNATYSVPVPNNVIFEGIDAPFQCLGINPGGGGSFNVIDFSDGLLVRIGDSIPACN